MSIHKEFINYNVLKNDPEQFMMSLRYCVRNDIDIIWELNNTETLETWYSSLLQCLFYLTGDLKESSEYDFYGNNDSVSEEVAINILYWMERGGSDYNVKDYYGKTVLDCIRSEEQNNHCLTSRINNENFVNILKYKCQQHIHIPVFTPSYDDRDEIYSIIEHAQFTC